MSEDFRTRGLFRGREKRQPLYASRLEGRRVDHALLDPVTVVLSQGKQCVNIIFTQRIMPFTQG